MVVPVGNDPTSICIFMPSALTDPVLVTVNVRGVPPPRPDNAKKDGDTVNVVTASFVLYVTFNTFANDD